MMGLNGDKRLGARLEARAVIPARGGSKGILKKNLQTVGGVSLVGRAVRAAQGAEIFSEIWVSTDSDEIAAEARNCGARILTRPHELAGDSTSTEEVLGFHLENELSGFHGVLALIQCTSPFLRSQSLREGRRLLAESNFGSVFSGVVDHGFRWIHGLNDSLVPLGHRKEYRPRRQDLPETILETGAFYMFHSDLFRKEQTRFCGQTGAVVVEGFERFEIDEQWELVLANAVCAFVQEGS